MKEFENLNAIKFPDIQEYCVQNGQVAWLKEIAAQKKVGKDGKERRISFIELRNAFARQFFPDLVPAPKPRKKSMFDIIDEL